MIHLNHVLKLVGVPVLDLLFTRQNNFSLSTELTSETGKVPARPWVIRHPRLFYFIFSLSIFFTLESHARIFDDLAFGGGVVVGNGTTGTLEVQGRRTIAAEKLWSAYYGFDYTIYIPYQKSPGGSLGVPLFLEFLSKNKVRPWLAASAGYGYIEDHFFLLETLFGVTFEVRSDQGLRVYVGWNQSVGHGVIIGALIFLAW